MRKLVTIVQLFLLVTATMNLSEIAGKTGIGNPFAAGCLGIAVALNIYLLIREN